MPLVAWGTWGASLLLLLVCIARDGWNLPRAEDWLLVPFVTGHQEGLAGWLWAQNNEHRVPVPRLVYGAILKTAGIDFRAGMVFNTLATGVIAFAMLGAAKRIRGRVTWADAFFPLVLLHLGHWDNLLWGWQIQFVLSTVFACTLLLIVVTGDRWSWGRALVAAVSLVALPLCGANGLAFAPGLGIWAAATGVRDWRERRARAALVVVGGAAAALLLTFGYFVNYRDASGYPPSPGVTASVVTAVKFLAMAFGPAAGASWATSVAATGAALGLTGALLLWTVWDRPGVHRRRALGLVAFLLSVLILAAGVGWGRAGRIEETARFPSRYALLAAPLLACVYLAWLLYGPRRWRPAVLGGLAVAAALALPENTLRGLSSRSWHLQGMRAVARDIDAGLPRGLLAERHQSFLMHWDRRSLEAGMAYLRQTGRGPFARLQEVAVRELQVWGSTPGTRPAGPPRELVITLPGAPRVYAVRVLFRDHAPAAREQRPTAAERERLRVVWTGRSGAGEEILLVPVSSDATGLATATIWVNASIATLRLEGAGAGRADAVSVVVPGSTVRGGSRDRSPDEGDGAPGEPGWSNSYIDRHIAISTLFL